MSEAAGAVLAQASKQTLEAEKECADLQADIRRMSFWLIDLAADLSRDPRSVDSERLRATTMERIRQLAQDYADACDRREDAHRNSIGPDLKREPGTLLSFDSYR